MDRNCYRTLALGGWGRVALRKESVDRNFEAVACVAVVMVVALRKESVDRNLAGGLLCCNGLVALRKESVDRNCPPRLKIDTSGSRSPQGERG